MTLPECLYTRPVAIRPSRLRTTARNAGVHFNFDGSPPTGSSMLRNQLRLRSGTGGRRSQVRSALSRQTTAGQRLSERTNSIVARMLTNLGVSAAAMDVARNAGGKGSNRVALTAMLNSKINDAVGIGKGQRSTLSAAQIDEVFARLDGIADEIVASVKQKLGK